MTGAEGTTLTAQGMGYLSVRKSPLATPALMGDFLKTTPNAIGDLPPARRDGALVQLPGRGGTRIYKLVQDAIQDAFLQKQDAEGRAGRRGEAANRLIAGRG